MRLQMTVVRADLPHDPLEVEVDCPAGATAADLSGALEQLLGREVAPCDIRVHGNTLGPEDLVGAGPLVDGAVLAVGAPPAPASSRTPAGRAGLSLVVVAGPDAGRQLDVRPGVLRVGRSAEADLVVDDPDLSRVHAELTVTPEGVTLRDLGSTNGSAVDGALVPESGLLVDTTSLIGLGSSRLRLRPTTGRPAAVGQAADGVRRVNRSPRIRRDVEPVTLTLPAPPRAPTRPRLPWVAILVPIPVGVVLALVFSPMMLVFTLMSPLLVAGNALSDRFSGKRLYAAQLREHAAAVRSVETTAAAAVVDEQRRRRWALPDPAEVLAVATTPAARLWERRPTDPDALVVRVGTWTARSRTRVLDPAEAGRERHPDVPDVPCPVALGDVGVLGIAGDRSAVEALARFVVGQLVTLHSPLDLRLWVLVADEDGGRAWRWASRLPHSRRTPELSDRGLGRQAAALDRPGDLMASAIHELQEVVDHRRRLQPGRGPWPGERVVVLVDGAERLRGLPGLSTLLRDGPDVGVVFIALDSTVDRLPSETGAAVELSTCPRSSRLRSRTGEEGGGLVVDGVGEWWAERLSRALAPLRDATPHQATGTLPENARLLDLLPVDALAPEQLAAQWAARPQTTRAVVGSGPAGPHIVDLRTDGPHILVGGTTGSGKSEFLQTLIASLAVGNRPDRLTFVLVDYKGGAAFKECAALPHTAGLVTDLDAHLTERALDSLAAELTRREALFAAVGATDLDGYESLAECGPSPVIPRLVIVIDEFRILAEELPTFITGLVRVAAVGRSLGVHLVLATQRPAGVVTSDIKANVNLRIALRMRDRVDSDDVIDSPEAAQLSERTPGRALARSGGGTVQVFQSARVGGGAPDTVPGIAVTPFDWLSPPAPRPLAARRAGSSTDLQRIVVALQQAATLAGASPPPSPWLPPLPDTVSVTDLPPRPGSSRWDLAVGLADRPASQRQDSLIWDLRSPGHWAAVGTAGSGKTSLLRLVAATAARQLSPAEVHLYAVDGGGGGLRCLEGLPHTGAVVQHGDQPRLGRLVRLLGEEVTRRKGLVSERGYTSVAEWRDGGADPAPAQMLLLVDGWEAVCAAADAVDHGALTDQLLGLLRAGPSAGLRLMATGDRGLLLGRASALFAERLVLRLGDPADAALAGLRASSLSGHRPPGRAVLAADGTEVQICWPGSGGDVAGSGSAVSDGSRGSGGRESAPCGLELRPELLPLRVQSLPLDLDLSELAPLPVRHGTDVWVGVGGDLLAPVGLDAETDGRRWLVAGPPRSGKTTALRTIAESLLHAGSRIAIVAERPGPLDELRGALGVACVVRPEGIAEVAAARLDAPRLVVIVDDADATLDHPADPVLREVARSVERDRGLLVCAATSATLATQYRGVAVEVARHQTGLLLSPRGPADADLFGIRAPRVLERVPGRGLLVARGTATDVQVARARPATAAYPPAPSRA